MEEWRVGVSIDTQFGRWPVFRLKNMHNPEDLKEIEAARKLFEAAPDLLDACKDFKFIPDCGGDFCIDENGEWYGEITTQEKCAHLGYCQWAHTQTLKFKAVIEKATT